MALMAQQDALMEGILLGNEWIAKHWRRPGETGSPLDGSDGEAALIADFAQDGTKIDPTSRGGAWENATLGLLDALSQHLPVGTAASRARVAQLTGNVFGSSAMQILQWQDMVWKAAGYRTTVAIDAYRAARAKGLTGDEFKAYVALKRLYPGRLPCTRRHGARRSSSPSRPRWGRRASSCSGRTRPE